MRMKVVMALFGFGGTILLMFYMFFLISTQGMNWGL